MASLKVVYWALIFIIRTTITLFLSIENTGAHQILVGTGNEWELNVEQAWEIIVSFGERSKAAYFHAIML